MPDLAVGRLVKTPGEIDSTVDHFLGLTDGTLPTPTPPWSPATTSSPTPPRRGPGVPRSRGPAARRHPDRDAGVTDAGDRPVER